MKQTFLEKLQSSDERVKTRWVLGLSAATMALVLVVWLNYFNGIVGQNPTISAVATNTENDFSFGRSLHDGTAFIYNAIIGKIGAIGNTITKPRDYTVKP